MNDILDALVQAMHDQALALQAVAEQIAALKQTLAKRDSELAGELNGQIEANARQAVADRVTAVQHTLAKYGTGLAGELKSQVETDQEKSRATLYDLLVDLASLSESISAIPKAAGKKAAPRGRKAPSATPKAHKAASRTRA